MDNNFEDKVYVEVDNYLKSIQNKSGVLYNLKSSPEGVEALKILDRYELINRRANRDDSMIDITIKGNGIVTSGGIKIFLDNANEKQKEKEFRERQKFDIDFKNAQRINKYFWLPLAISILSLLATAAKFILD